MKLSKTEKDLIKRISQSWSRDKDKAQPLALETEIQFQMSCSYGKALTLANEVRLEWGPN